MTRESYAQTDRAGGDDLRRNTRRAKQAVDNWNVAVKVGAAVSYRRDDGSRCATTTRSKAQLFADQTPVIWLDGISGCVPLDRVTPRRGGAS